MKATKLEAVPERGRRGGWNEMFGVMGDDGGGDGER